MSEHPTQFLKWRSIFCDLSNDTNFLSKYYKKLQESKLKNYLHWLDVWDNTVQQQNIIHLEHLARREDHNICSREFVESRMHHMLNAKERRDESNWLFFLFFSNDTCN